MGACVICCMRKFLTDNDTFDYEVHDGEGHHKLILRVERDDSCDPDISIQHSSTPT